MTSQRCQKQLHLREGSERSCDSRPAALRLLSSLRESQGVPPALETGVDAGVERLRGGGTTERPCLGARGPKASCQLPFCLEARHNSSKLITDLTVPKTAAPQRTKPIKPHPLFSRSQWSGSRLLRPRLGSLDFLGVLPGLRCWPNGRLCSFPGLESARAGFEDMAAHWPPAFPGSMGKMNCPGPGRGHNLWKLCTGGRELPAGGALLVRFGQSSGSFARDGTAKRCE